MSEDEIKKLQAEINGRVRTDIGAFCRLIGVIFMQKLPKTRSGKILRGTIRKIANQMKFGMPATIDDASTLDLVKE
jgi:propionyl-CoA synthetase